MSAEWAERLTPEPFRDFLPYTSLSALKVIHTRQVIEQAIRVVQHSASQASRTRRASALADSVAAAGLGVQVAHAPVGPLSASRLTPESRAAIGARVLSLYFHQLYGQTTWFLDLRPRHFAWNDETQTLSFFPSNLWYQPDPDFRRRVQSLYTGFYRRDRAALRAGLELYGWESRAEDGFWGRLESLLREHFGPGDSRQTRFHVAHFRATFDAIFQEAARSRAKLHPGLTFLGVELVGLYLTLESLQVPLDPRSAFETSAPLHTGPQIA
jgi:hypothetical protein